MTQTQVKEIEKKIDYLTHKVDYLVEYIVKNDSPDDVIIEPVSEDELTVQDKTDVKRAKREVKAGQVYSLEQVKKMLNV